MITLTDRRSFPYSRVLTTPICWETDHRDMDAFVAPLVAAGRRVVAFDHPAHGESTGERASIPDLARTVAAVCAAAGGADAIVGHSVGCAAIGVALASGLAVRSAVFVAPPLRYEIFVRAVARREGLDGDAVVAAFAELGLDVGALDVRENGASLDVPLLIVHSRDDRVCDPDNATAIAAAWQGARTRFVDGLGHARILRDPEVVRDVCDFVATGAPG